MGRPSRPAAHGKGGEGGGGEGAARAESGGDRQGATRGGKRWAPSLPQRAPGQGLASAPLGGSRNCGHNREQGPDPPTPGRDVCLDHPLNERMCLGFLSGRPLVPTTALGDRDPQPPWQKGKLRQRRSPPLPLTGAPWPSPHEPTFRLKPLWFCCSRLSWTQNPCLVEESSGQCLGPQPRLLPDSPALQSADAPVPQAFTHCGRPPTSPPPSACSSRLTFHHICLP